MEQMEGQRLYIVDSRIMLGIPPCLFKKEWISFSWGFRIYAE
jgi:hypothetical protein